MSAPATLPNPITLPPLAEIAERIQACREELAALRKLHRLARTAGAAREPRARRQGTPTERGRWHDPPHPPPSAEVQAPPGTTGQPARRPASVSGSFRQREGPQVG